MDNNRRIESNKVSLKYEILNYYLNDILCRGLEAGRSRQVTANNGGGRITYMAYHFDEHLIASLLWLMTHCSYNVHSMSLYTCTHRASSVLNVRVC